MKRMGNGTFARKYYFNEKFFNTQSHEFAWLIGFIASDGHIRKNNKTIVINQKEKEKIIYITNLIESTRSDYFNFYLHSFRIVQILNQYNINNKKTFFYRFPNKLNKCYYSSFLAGYIEGDGCIGVYDNGSGKKYLKISIYGATKFIQDINNKILIKGNILKKNNTHSEISWNGSKAIIFLNWIFSYNKIYKGKKYLIFNEYMSKLYKNTEKYKYDKKRSNVKKILKKEKNIIKIAQTLNIPFQTIYKWKKKGLLC